MSKLYIVPTPIGNLDDITLRAVRVLREVDLILAEDTRTTQVLLRHLGIEKRMWSSGISNTVDGNERIMIGEFSMRRVRNSKEAWRVSSSIEVDRAIDTMAWIKDSNYMKFTP